MTPEVYLPDGQLVVLRDEADVEDVALAVVEVHVAVEHLCEHPHLALEGPRHSRVDHVAEDELVDEGGILHGEVDQLLHSGVQDSIEKLKAKSGA